MTKMPDVIYAEATSLIENGLLNSFGNWIGGADEPSDPFNDRYVHDSLCVPQSVIKMAVEALEDYFTAKKTADVSDPGDYMLQEAIRLKFSYARDEMEKTLAALRPYLKDAK